MQELLADWGAFLDVRLYEQALIHFSGGEYEVLREIPLSRDGCALGVHRLPIHSNDLAFAVTAFNADASLYESHLRRLLAHTPLRGIQWINLAHGNIQFVSLAR
jgi:hypothetical protein